MKTVIIDVRTPAEFKLGSIKGALNIPSTEFTIDSYQAYKKNHISLVCSGGNRAEMVQEVLREKGFEHVSTMLWHMDNLEFDKVEDSNWTVDRQFRLVLGVLLAIFLFGISFEIRAIMAIPITICCGLLFSAFTNNCFLKMGIAALPWNKKQGRTSQSENAFNNQVSSTAIGQSLVQQPFSPFLKLINMNKIYSVMVLLALCYTVNAQNVGVGTTNPNARLHVNGVIKTDSTLVVKPSTKAASNSISIGKSDGFVTISNTANAQTNAITMIGTPRPGQWLGISNQDDNDATFASTTIGAGTVGFFIYDGAAWKPLQNGGGNSTALDSLTDADGDTKIQVEATPDEDRIRLVIPAGAYPQEWVFNYNNIIPPQRELISIGENAGKNLIGDEYSTILIGTNAGYNLTDEVIGVTVLGNNALTSAGETERSTAIGAGSLQFAKGSENTALGSNAGSGSSSGYSGSGNTFIGTFSGYKAAGSSNAFLGASAGYNATGSSNVFLGTSAGYYETGSNKLYIENSRSSSPLIYGEFDSNLVRINGTFDINNAYHFPLADGTNGQVLSTNGSGQLSWSTLSSNSIADADNDTKIQVEESADEDIIRFDLGGTEKWLMTGNRLEPSSDNTLIGQSAGTAITSGTGNTAYGANALKANTTATNNSAFGFNALLSATTGQYNGAYGTNAGYSLTTGNQNVFVGNSAGYTNSTGSNNTFIGQYAGFSNTGSGNVFIGRNAGGNETGSNKLYISNSNDATPLIYGEFDNDKLTFNAQIRVNGITEINGGLRPFSDNTRELGSSSKRWLAVYSTNGTIQTSDARFKTNVIDMEYGLDQLMQLRSVTYNWKEDSTGATKLGFIAQELEQVLPEVVHVGNDSLQTRGVNYAELVPVLVKAIQEQQKQIEEYKNQIADSANENAVQDQRLADLEAELRLFLNTSNASK